MRRLIESFRYARRIARLPDVPDWQRTILAQVRPFTMTTPERIIATIAAVEYVVEAGIEGDIVECGVWRGGQMMAAAMTLQHLGVERDIRLFDTFSGMTAPGALDKDLVGEAAGPVYEKSLTRAKGDRWCEASLEDVTRNLLSTGYPVRRIHFIEGDVEATIPGHAPSSIAYLRLDTDWYASTAHELLHLYPRVSLHGVVAIDDYGHWQGSRKATDEYLSGNGIKVLMNRIDYTGRQFLKV